MMIAKRLRNSTTTKTMTNKLVIILGPTAVGKTDYSIETALKYDSPIISCD